MKSGDNRPINGLCRYGVRAMIAEAGPERISELSLSSAWNDQRFGEPLRTTDGRSLTIVHRGAWTHGFGPDFRDAMILLDGRDLLTGSIEIHLSTGAWRDHGHHLDPRYDDVVLHAVLRHDGSETRRSDGALVPVVELGIDVDALRAVPVTATDWARMGGEVCAEELARDHPAEIRAILWRLGDVRLAAKSARIEARLTELPPGEVLYQELLDGLGFSANREPMRAVASRLPLADLETALGTVSPGQRLHLARGLLFGVAGFLPLSPAEALFARIGPAESVEAERFWFETGIAWHDECLPATAWTRARVRPANHPALRLSAAAALVASARGGLVSALLAPLRQGSDPVVALRELATWDGEAGIGEDRAIGLVVNALIPFALALAEHTGDSGLADRAAAAWERLPPAESNEVTRRALRQVAGSSRLANLGARGQQGLLHLDGALCAPRRCYECPIAARVLRTE
ncbi:MAG TPA: DUF2851 family protein [Thermomicrobiales bacterium]|jgi:hypothetical protein